MEFDRRTVESVMDTSLLNRRGGVEYNKLREKERDRGGRGMTDINTDQVMNMIKILYFRWM